MDRKDQFEKLFYELQRAFTKDTGAYLATIFELMKDGMGILAAIAKAESEHARLAEDVTAIKDQLWAMVSCPTPPAPINTVPGLLATVDEYAQAHVALSQTRTPHTRAKASQRAESLRLAIKMAVEG